MGKWMEAHGTVVGSLFPVTNMCTQIVFLFVFFRDPGRETAVKFTRNQFLNPNGTTPLGVTDVTWDAVGGSVSQDAGVQLPMSANDTTWAFSLSTSLTWRQIRNVNAACVCVHPHTWHRVHFCKQMRPSVTLNWLHCLALLMLTVPFCSTGWLVFAFWPNRVAQ